MNCSNQKTFNLGWKFRKKDISAYKSPGFNDNSWESVSIPHTWNAFDVLDDEAEMYKGPGWYRKYFNPGQFAKEKVYIFFEGANQDTTVYVNGGKAGVHTGGFTAFIFDITDFLKPEQKNLIAVRVSNIIDKNIYCKHTGRTRNKSISASPQGGNYFVRYSHIKTVRKT